MRIRQKLSQIYVKWCFTLKCIIFSTEYPRKSKTKIHKGKEEKEQIFALRIRSVCQASFYFRLAIFKFKAKQNTWADGRLGVAFEEGGGLN